MYKDESLGWFLDDSKMRRNRNEPAGLEFKYRQAQKEIEKKDAEFKNQYFAQENKIKELATENDILKQQVKVKNVDDLLSQVSDDKPADDSALCLIM